MLWEPIVEYCQFLLATRTDLIQGGARNVIPFYHPIKIVATYARSIDVTNVRVNAVVHGKCDRRHQFVKWRTTGG